MMGQPAHRFLEEFAVDVAVFPSAIAGLKQHSAQRQQSSNDAAADQVAIRIQQAYAQGYAAGEDAERQAAEARVAEIASEADRRLDEAHAQFGRDLAGRLARDLGSEIARARDRLAGQIAMVLLPLMRRRLTEDCVQDLAMRAASILEADDAMIVDLRGPETLVDMVVAAFESLPVEEGSSVRSRLRCHPGKGSTLSVEFGDSVIEARLAEWLGQLDEICAP